MLQPSVVVPPAVMEVVVGGGGDGDVVGVGEGVGGLQVTNVLQVCVHLQQNVLKSV